MTVKLSLVAAFLMTMATLTFAASGLPAPEAELAVQQVSVASIGAIKTADSQVRTVAMPAGVVPAAAVELMASL
jgi:hypothetical protein